jgi:hypothetical protein
MRLGCALAIVVAACSRPSPLERALEAGSDDSAAWRAIAFRARPFDTAAAQLDAALVATSPPERVAALEAWVAAGGRIGRVPPLRAIDAGDLTVAIGALGLDAAAASGSDDRALEAALYTAQRLRRDGDDLTATTAAVAIVRKAIQVRPRPPVLAAGYAPTDAEVVRGFAAEAMALARTYAWSTTADAARVPARAGKSYKDLAAGDPLADWTWLADAPTDRDGFTAALARHAGHAPELVRYARTLFDNVDAYRRWLAASPP